MEACLKNNAALSRLFRVMATLAAAGVAWAMLSNILSAVLTSWFNFLQPSEVSLNVLYMYNFISLFIADGITIGIAAVLLIAAKYMTNPLHRTLLRVSGIISIITISFYLLYMLLQTNVNVFDVESDNLYDILALIVGTQVLPTMLKLSMPMCKILCAACFVKHPQTLVKGFAIATLAGMLIHLVMNLLPIHYNLTFTAITYILSLIVGTLNTLFFFTVSNDYRKAKGVDNA